MREDLRAVRLDHLLHGPDRGHPVVDLGLQGHQLVTVEDAGLDPGDVDAAGHLVDLTLDQTSGQGLHHEELDLLVREPRLGGDLGKGQLAVGGRALEGHLHEGEEADLLVEDLLVGLEVGLRAPLGLHGVELAHVARVEGPEKLDEPLVVGLLEELEDGVGEELAKVEDVLAEEGGQREVRGEGEVLCVGPLAELGDAEVAEASLVEVGVFAELLVVVAGEEVELPLDDADALDVLQDLVGLCDQFLQEGKNEDVNSTRAQ